MNAAAALIGAVGSFILLIALVAMHMMRTGLSPLSDPVSAYALTRARAAYAVAAVAASVAGGASAALLGEHPGSAPAVMLLCAFVVTRLVIPLFPMDRPGTVSTPRGRLHGLLATVAFATVTAAAFTAIHPLATSGDAVVSLGTTIAAVAMAIGSVLIIAARAMPVLRRIFGLAERLIYLGFIAWFLLLSFDALTH